jgi:hypothetical protein
MKESLQKALDTGDVGKVPSFFLGRLFRKLLIEMHVGPTRWAELAGVYREPGFTGTRKQENDTKRRLMANLAKPNISVRNFLPAMRFLRVKSFKLTLEVEFHNAPSVSVSDTVNVGYGEHHTTH